MKTLSLLFALLTVSSVAFAANELDRDQQINAPQTVLVRVQAATQNVTIFKADKVDASAINNAASAVASIKEIAKAENVITKQVKAVNLASELDKDDARQAWCYYYYGNYWAPTTYFTYTPYYYNYSYNYAYNYAYTYNYNYAYTYNWGGYNWYWYHW